MKGKKQAERLLRALTDVDDRYIIEAAEIPFSGRQKRLNRRMHTRFAAAAAACLVLLGVGSQLTNHPTPQSDPDITLNVSPLQEVDSIAEAEAITGFAFHVPEAREPYCSTAFIVLDKALIEVNYLTDDGGEIGYSIRKSRGTEDISGDYNEYTENATLNVNGNEVTIRGENGLCAVAIWTDGVYTYAIGAQNHPVTQDEMLALISAVE